MALNSINTNVGALFAQQNIGRASTKASLSIARLSSGQRIVQASDDVAALSAGTSLRTQVTTLRQALINTSQGASLLQVADGALSQITDILQRQKAIAVQAGAGSLSADERSFLNQEFQQLSQEIDRLTGTTNFNGVTLLDGSVFDKNILGTNDQVGGQAEGNITILTIQAAGKNLVFNGLTFSSVAAGPTGNQFLAGATTAEMLDSLVATLNASTDVRVSRATYSRVGNTLLINSDSGGSLGRTYTFDISTYGAANVAVGAQLLSGTRYNLQGGTDAGLGFGRTVATGVIGDNLVLAQSQTTAQRTLNFSNSTIGNFVAGKTVTFAGAAQTFTFITTAPTVAGDVLIGSTVEETLDNLVQSLRNYINFTTVNVTNHYVFDQLEYRRDGKTVIIEKGDSGLGNLVTDGNAAVTVVTNVANAFPTAAANFNNATFTGVTTSGITNGAFVGSISGFQATYNGVNNRVDLSITVGGIEYISANVNTAVTANTTIRFSSLTGGYFDVDFAANNGTTVNDQAGANVIASRLDAAFSGLQFYQSRSISSYEGAGDILTSSTVTGSLTGSTLDIRLKDFTEVNLEDIRVSAPAAGGTNGTIEFVINGKTFRSEATLTSQLGQRGTYRFINLEDANEYIELNASTSRATFFRNAEEAAALEQALKDALGFGEGGVALNFQVGSTTEDTLEVTIGDASTESIYNGQTLDVLTQASAAFASDVLDDALNAITSIRADVGSLQSRFNFAAANVESSIQNQDAARGVLLDTDIAAESTSFATSQVQLQAGIAVLAQANLLPQNLLKLIG